MAEYEIRKDGDKIKIEPEPNPFDTIYSFLVFVIMAALIGFLLSRCGGSSQEKTVASEEPVYGDVASFAELDFRDVYYPEEKEYRGAFTFSENSNVYGTKTDYLGQEHSSWCEALCSTDQYPPATVFTIPDGFSTCSGTAYMREEYRFGYSWEKKILSWLEFYDGDRLIYSTEKIGYYADKASASFSFSVKGVSELKVVGRAENPETSFYDCEYLILDPFTISR